MRDGVGSRRKRGNNRAGKEREGMDNEGERKRKINEIGKERGNNGTGRIGEGMR